MSDDIIDRLRALPPEDLTVPVDRYERIRVRARRRRTGRLLAAAAAAALLAAGATAGYLTTTATGDRQTLRFAGAGTPTPAPTSVDLAGAVPWADTPAPPYQPLTPSPTPPPASDARPCTVADVRATAIGGNGGGGTSVDIISFRNVSTSTCVLKGYPHVVATEPGHPPVTAVDGHTTFPAPVTANMAPGQTTNLSVETYSFCAAWPGGAPSGQPIYHQLAITVPGGGTLTVRQALNVVCGVHVSHFWVQRPPLPSPHDPLEDLQVSLQMPNQVAAGATLRYVATLTNPTGTAISLRRCPGYLEWAGGLPTPVKQSYALNCGPVGAIPAHRSVRFAMRMLIPADAPRGALAVFWMLAGPGPVEGKAAVQVSSDRVPARGTLVVTFSPAGIAGKHLDGPGQVTFTARANGRRYTADAEGNGAFTASVPPGRYAVTGTSTQFSGGGTCQAAGTVTVPASGASGIVVTCPYK